LSSKKSEQNHKTKAATIKDSLALFESKGYVMK
jgi:hypothetical protein